MKQDWKKNQKELYGPKGDPTILEVPALSYVLIEGSGDPNGPAFAEETGALYAISYALRMSHKGGSAPEGYQEYTVYPLEGEWDLVEPEKGSLEKSNYRYRIMIRQPEFLTKELFLRLLEDTRKKKKNPALDRVRLEEIEEGLCCQMLHQGPYGDEPESFRRMEEVCEAEGYRRISKKHREIYLSDPRKTEGSKLRTILRFQVERAD